MENKVPEDIVDRAEDYADEHIREDFKDLNEIYNLVFEAYKKGAEDESKRWYEGLTEGEIKIMDLFLERPKAMIEMYKQNSDLLIQENVAGWWQEQYMICDAHRQQLIKEKG